jgi:S-formylglutathione hydrolase FrmB
MPAVHRSFYANMVHGGKYWDYVSKELPEVARTLFPLSARREDTFAAGNSMGGYGAFKLALACPKRVCAAASLSGALDIAGRAASTEDPVLRADLERAVGNVDKLSGSENDLFHLAAKAARSRGPKPRLYQWCGTDDFLYEDNRRARARFESLKLKLTYEEGPGAHDWAAWDQQLPRVLEWLVAERTKR